MCQAVSRTGNDGGVPDGSKVGLVAVEDPELFCRGVVGNRGARPVRWCTRPAGEYMVKSHEMSKVNLKERHLYMKCPKKLFQAGESPSQNGNSDSIPESDVESLLDRLEPIEVWASYMSAVRNHKWLQRLQVFKTDRRPGRYLLKPGRTILLKVHL